MLGRAGVHVAGPCPLVPPKWPACLRRSVESLALPIHPQTLRLGPRLCNAARAAAATARYRDGCAELSLLCLHGVCWCVALTSPDSGRVGVLRGLPVVERAVPGIAAMRSETEPWWPHPPQQLPYPCCSPVLLTPDHQTSVRHSGMGMGSLSARVGSVVASGGRSTPRLP